jgi:hypothetical protein
VAAVISTLTARATALATITNADTAISAQNARDLVIAKITSALKIPGSIIGGGH